MSSQASYLRRVCLLALCLLGPTPARAQQPIKDVQALAFDRPESWAMEYFASLSLPTAIGFPERLGAKMEVGVESGLVPQLSDAQRRVGFDGTKLEAVNRTRFLGRVRAKIGLPASYWLELGYVPPITIRGATPNIFSAAVGRPFALSPNWQVGLRLYGQLGTMKADITCSVEEAAAGSDLARNPLGCQAASNDELKQRLVGVEVSVGYGSGRWRPYVGASLSHLHLEFQVDARYAGLVDRTLQTTSGENVYLITGVGFAPSGRWRLAAELFYAPLSVVRPPAVSSRNDGLLNERLLVSYRF